MKSREFHIHKGSNSNKSRDVDSKNYFRAELRTNLKQ